MFIKRTAFEKHNHLKFIFIKYSKELEINFRPSSASICSMTKGIYTRDYTFTEHQHPLLKQRGKVTAWAILNKYSDLFLNCPQDWNIHAFVKGPLLSQHPWLQPTQAASANRAAALKTLSELPPLSLSATPSGQSLTLNNILMIESEVGNTQNPFSLFTWNQM